VTALGVDAVALMINLMGRNHDETAQILTGLHESVQRDLDEARATIGRIRRNVAIVLARPHTDAMIAGALRGDRDYEDPDACA
jgi:hypothetical protein